MIHALKQITRNPLWMIALLAPYLGGIPTPGSPRPWRQEVVITLLLGLTCLSVARRALITQFPTWRPNRIEIAILSSLLLFVLWSLASASWATNAMPALYHTSVWAIFLIFFIFARLIAESPRLLRVSLVVLAIVIGIISVCCLTEVAGEGLTQFRRLGYGEPLALSVPLFTALALNLRRRRATLFCGVVALLAWLSILLLLERGAFIGASAALVFLFLAPIFNRRWRPRSWGRATVIAVAFCVAAWAATFHEKPKVGSVVTRLAATSTEETNTAARLLFWGIAIEELRAHPLTGVGANNYDVAYPEARAAFSRRYPASQFVVVNEQKLAERAHNEYLQILAELGIVGFTLLATFAVALLCLAWRVVRRGNSSLALGACGSLLAFALTSGVTSASFRWTGSALIFFFAAALVTRFGVTKSSDASSTSPATAAVKCLQPVWLKHAAYASATLTFSILCGFLVIAANQISLGMAQNATSPESAVMLARTAYKLNPYDAPTNFTLGGLLYQDGNAADAVPLLRFATERGYNVVSCYAALAMAESAAGDLEAAEKTLAHATKVYPRSIFIRTRHAFALGVIDRHEEAAQQLAFAVKLDSRAAKGWWELHNNGANAAAVAARLDASIAPPRELLPEDCVLMIAGEQKRQQSVARAQSVKSGNAN